MKYKTGDCVQLVDIDNYKGGRLCLDNSMFSKDRIVTLKDKTLSDNWRIQESHYIVPENLISHILPPEIKLDIPEPDEQNRVEMWGYLKLAELALKEGLE